MSNQEKQRIYIDFPSEVEAEEFEDILHLILCWDHKSGLLSQNQRELLDIARKNFTYE